MSIQIIYPSEQYFESFHKALSIVARERVYIEMIEAPPLSEVVGFQSRFIAENGPAYYAVDGNRVVGWCDVSRNENPRQSHRGDLGMGLIPEYRGRGWGTKLLTTTLDHGRKIGLEKVELRVYTTNLPAISLYKKHGFDEEGIIKRYQRLDGQYFDCLAMGKFL